MIEKILWCSCSRCREWRKRASKYGTRILRKRASIKLKNVDIDNADDIDICCTYSVWYTD